MIRKAPLKLLALMALSISSASMAAAGQNICEREMTRAATRYDVPLGVLHAVGMTETGRRGSLHPFAMNIAGRSYFASGIEEALAEFRAARARGIDLIDLGCMQINYYYHGEKFSSVRAMFDPARNVAYAAAFLHRLREREGSWTMAVARYHAGPDNNPAQKRYVCAVIRNLVASGFGAWTRNSKAFCNH